MSAAKYTKLVMFWKTFLWLMVAAIIAIVIWIASNNGSDSGGRMIFTNPQKTEENMQNVMKKPHYQGVNENNRPYTIDAVSALQKDKDTVILTKIVADMTTDTGAWVAIQSGSGELNTTTKQLELSKGVEIFYDGGNQLRTDHAHVDIAKNSASGDSHVEGSGESGTIEANSFIILERGDIIKFNGSVRMLLYRK